MDLFRFLIVGLTSLLTAACLLVPLTQAQAAEFHNTPATIPPSQSCIEFVAEEEEANWGKRAWNIPELTASYQRIADAGCLTHNAMTFNPAPNWMNYDLCVSETARLARYWKEISAWAEPYVPRFKAINRRGVKLLDATRNAMWKTANKKKLRQLEAKERRQIAQIKAQLLALGRQTYPRHYRMFVAGGIPRLDLLQRGCDLQESPEFSQAQPAYWASHLATWPVTFKKYNRQISNYFWDAWYFEARSLFGRGSVRLTPIKTWKF